MEKIDLNYFENILIYKSLTDEAYLSEVINFIKPEYFYNKNIKKIYTIIKNYYDKRGTLPSTSELKTYFVNDDIKESFKEVAKQFKDIDKGLNSEELLENTERYIKERAIYNTMMDVAEDISKGNIDTSYILDKFEKSCRVDLKNDIGLNLFENLDKLVANLESVEPVISTKWDWLDEKLNGGFRTNGRALYVFAGQSNIGKSIVLGNMVTNMARQGKNILLISLEMPELMYAERLASDITKIPMNNLSNEIPSLKAAMSEQSDEMGTILIKEFPPNSITCQQISSFIKVLLTKGISIDAIVIDYLNLVKGNGQNLYEKNKSVTEDIRAISYKFNCPVITATQLNRTGYDTDIPRLDTVGESIGIVATADAIFGVTQSDEDKELNIINIHSMKNRFNSNFGKNQMRIDYNTLTIYEDSLLNDDEGDMEELTSTLNMLSMK